MCVVEIGIDVAAGQSVSLLFVEAYSVRSICEIVGRLRIVMPGLWATPESARTITVKARSSKGQLRSLLCREYKVTIGVDGVVHEVPVVEWPLEQPFDGILVEADQSMH
ncbi:hypothetical protein PsorP6_004177 [Peronosclerospora sorghi]|uniref:Uncharacterized protein n=1 Tax=Peronosclerospora sorghi TaxID=230839 RepID=A0ACC0VMV7_9STRA|nr:hypothetical protein PsorP6_004177 [Peronosclerospora sorghi]